MQEPLWHDASSNPGRINGIHGNKPDASFISPIYERLETNIPRGLMRFPDLDWPQDSQLFPQHETVLQYITDYAKDVHALVQYSTQVFKVEPADQDYGGRWTVSTRDLHTNSCNDEVFDAVIVANGHFNVPYVPHVPGIERWRERYPGSISHAKYYRRPEDFSGKKVIVVGNSASGYDISTQISHFAQSPLLWSSKSPTQCAPAPSPSKRELPPIVEFLTETRGVQFADRTVESDIDAIVFATGYFYSLPFLENIYPKLITDGSHVHHTYKHLFYTPRPTLSFLALPQRVVPFPLAAAQAAVLARVYSNRLPLPPLATMLAWESTVVSETRGDGRAFHLLPFPKDGEYINEMARWAMSAEARQGLEEGGRGKPAPVWDEREFWCRERCPAIRRSFVARVEGRKKVRALEEVGFRFEEREGGIVV